MRSSRVWRFANPYGKVSAYFGDFDILDGDSRVQRGRLTIAVFGGKNSREK
jgi:hypothetical protein